MNDWILELTYDCNYTCFHCNAGFGAPKNTGRFVTLEEVKARNFSEGITVTGGEPLYNPYFIEISEYLAKNGHKLLLQTNASLFTPKLIEAVKKFYKRIIVSFNACDESIYNKLSGTTGNLFKVVKNIQELTNSSLGVLTTSIIQKDNLAHLPVLIDFLNSEFSQAGSMLAMVHGVGQAGINDCFISYTSFLETLSKEVSKFRKYYIIYDIPRCVTAKYPQLITDKSKYQFCDYRREYKQIKNCEGCKFISVCPGVSRAYLNKYGDSEIVAQKIFTK